MSKPVDTGPALARDVAAKTGLNPARCYQCGKCTAGCPMAEEMPTRPHQMMRLVQLGRRALLSDPSIWLCLTCETCSSRCPMDVEPARIIDALRELALAADPEVAPRRIRALHSSFLEQIRSNGRMFEFGLVLGSKLRSGALFADVTAAPGMMTRGKLSFSPQRIEGLDEIQQIFDACEPASGR